MINWWCADRNQSADLACSFFIVIKKKKQIEGGFPGGSGIKDLPANAEDTGLTPDLEGPTCRRRATKPVRHNYEACTLEPRLNHWASWAAATETLSPRTHAWQQENSPQGEACTPPLESSLHSTQLEKSLCRKEDPAQPKI